MARKTISMHYFYAIIKNNDETERLLDLTDLFNVLKNKKPEERIKPIKSDENIQLKNINYNEKFKRWNLCFLKNISDAPFITKLSDTTDKAESLDEDEFVGQECCLIYDEMSKITSIQNNRSSISFRILSKFLSEYMEGFFEFSPIVYQKKYTEISDDEEINYKSIEIGYTDISKIQKLTEASGDEAVEDLAKIAMDLSAINGKIELNVGRQKNFLVKKRLKSLVNFFKKNPEVTKSLKVKMIDEDGIRFIDLINNKVVDKKDIIVTKEDPKTFDKILNVMNLAFDEALEETFDKCVMFVEN
ncbi:TPA: DUF6731 family protein [Clostridium perfringens]